MRKALYILTLILLLVCGCTKPAIQEPSINDQIAMILSTRAYAPLEGTIWENKTGDEYDKYVWFNDGFANLYYGKVEDGELQRWSDFFSAPYEFYDGKIYASIEYPEWGKTEKTKNMNVIVVEDNCTLNIDGAEFKYISSDASDIDDEMWMIIHVGILPWN